MPGALVLAQTEDAQRVQGSRPAIEEDRPAQTAAEHHDAQKFVLPVRIVEEPEEADRTRKREDDSDKREEADLIEQRRAADAATRGASSAERQEDLSLAQAVFAGIGTIGLIAALLLTVQSNRAALRAATAAEKAADDAADSYKRQLRAYLTAYPEAGSIVKAGEKIRFSIRIVNEGQTPAKNAAIGTNIFIRNLPFSLAMERAEGGSMDIPNAPKQTIWKGVRNSVPKESSFVLPASHYEAIKNGQVGIFYIGTIEYEDIYNDRHKTYFRFEFSGAECIRTGRLRLSKEGNDFT